MSKETVNAIRAATWRNVAEAHALAAAGDVDANEMLQVLDLLLHKVLAADAERHAMRRQAFAALVTRRPEDALFRPFVRAMKQAPPDVRQVLAELLPRVAQGSDPAELVDALRSPDVDLRVAAGRALADIGGKNVFTAVAGVVNERGFPGLKEALEVAV